MDKRPEYYRLEGKQPVPCSRDEAWEFRRARGIVRVGLDEFEGVAVSTVFLRMDEGDEGPPLVFETLIQGGDMGGEIYHYSTWAEAEKGHAAAVHRVRMTMPNVMAGE